MTNDATAQQVKDANRRLYDATARDYEAIDGRRTDSLHRYVREQMQELRRRAPGGRLLDLGCGAGFAAQCAQGVFEHRTGVDISAGILDAWQANFDETLVGDVDDVPCEDTSFDAIVCFALLHHLPETADLAREIARLLKPGGVLYTDHDMDAAFHHRFGWPLRLYRRLRSAEEHYGAAGVEEGDYELAECRADGIDTAAFLEHLRANGLEAEARFHWYGLTRATDAVFGHHDFSRGWAPLARVFARKPQAPEEPQT